MRALRLRPQRPRARVSPSRPDREGVRVSPKRGITRAIAEVEPGGREVRPPRARTATSRWSADCARLPDAIGSRDRRSRITRSRVRGSSIGRAFGLLPEGLSVRVPPPELSRKARCAGLSRFRRAPAPRPAPPLARPRRWPRPRPAISPARTATPAPPAPCASPAAATSASSSRHGSISPAPDHATRAPVSAMSPTAGQHTSGHAGARALARPSRARRGRSPGRATAITWEYESQSTTTAFAGGVRQRLGGKCPFVVASTRTGSSASASSATRTSRQSGSWAVDAATSTSGPSPSGSSTSGYGSSNANGPVTCTSAGQLRGYSSCGNVATSASCSEIPPCSRSVGLEPHRGPRHVHLIAPALQATHQHRQRPSPHRPADRRARRHRADREERQPRLLDRIDVRNQRRPLQPGPLGGKGGREREDVADDHVEALLAPSAAAAPAPHRRPSPPHRRRERAAETSCTPRRP